MRYGSIERDIHVEASPEVVFDVISRPEHMQEWWPDEARFEPVPGAPGTLAWRDDNGDTMTVLITVVEVDPPKRFSFRWCYTDSARNGDSLLVTFELEPAGSGTRIRLTETGFREMNWETALLEARYREHLFGWVHHLRALGAYIGQLVATL